MTEQEYEALEGSTWCQRWHGIVADAGVCECADDDETAHTHDCVDCGATVVVSLAGEFDCSFCEGEDARCPADYDRWVASLPVRDALPF